MKSLGNLRVVLAIAATVGVLLSAASCRREQSVAPNAIDSGDEKVAIAKIAEGDQLYAGREDMAKARVAVAALRQAVTADYGNYEAAWKLARASFFVGDHTKNDDEADDMFRTGIEAGKAAVKLQADKPDGHFWLGANYGGDASRSTLASLAAVQDIRTQMETVIKIDDKFQGGSAYLGLGRLYLQAPKVLGGDTSKAIDYLKKGLAISPNNSLMKYYLAAAYKSENRDAEAKKLIEDILSMTPDPQYVAEHKDAIAKAEKLKQKIG
ncbi:MAG TPA: TRAP transporter TatT component family protein [Pyrinomonadaceae bacterium]|nr:TRAP transporter TatT component family protein [Pyrinomonadaceae bacterium]